MLSDHTPDVLLIREVVRGVETRTQPRKLLLRKLTERVEARDLELLRIFVRWREPAFEIPAQRRAVNQLRTRASLPPTARSSARLDMLEPSRSYTSAGAGKR